MVTTDFANWILQFVDYGITILVIMAIIETFRLIVGPTAGTVASNLGKGIWDKLKSLPRGMERRAKREESRTLGEFVEEKKELKLVEGLPDVVHGTVTILAQTSYEPELTQDRWNDINTHLGSVRDGLGNAVDEFRDLQKSTSRQETETARLIRMLKNEGGISDSDIQAITAMEKDILKLHDATARALKAAQDKVAQADNTHLRPIFAEIKKKKKVPLAAVVAGADIKTRLEAAKNALENNVLPEVMLAVKTQRKALEMLDGIVVKFRGLWK